jgi:Domain of unknown function (DUF4157)
MSGLIPPVFRSSPKRSLSEDTSASGQHTFVGDQYEERRSERSSLFRPPRALAPPVVAVAAAGNVPAQETVPSLNSVVDRAAGFGRDFSQVPIHSIRTSAVQTKLDVSRPGDLNETEADRVSEHVMRMTDPAAPASADGDGAVASLMRQQDSAPQAGAGPDISTVPSVVHAVLSNGRGRPLDPAARVFMEPRFGRDFSQVRVHADQSAADAAGRMAARAFTVGQHIVFGSRQYSPDSTAGRRLLAHELTHTIQQRNATAAAGILRQPIPGWNFTPADFARQREAGRGLTIAPDSGFFPAKLQENLLKTLAYVLGPAILPGATEGINATDFFHGHLVVKKDPATAKQAKSAEAKGVKFSTELSRERAKALGGEVSFSKGYPLTSKNIGAYQKAVEKTLPSFGSLLDEVSKLPGAAVMYHTFEFNQPRDLKAKGEKLKAEDPRRHYVTPLDTNTPRQYTPPSGGYEKEYTHITSFSFLVDDKATVHVRPLSASTGFTTLELSTITGTTFPEPLEFDK